MRACGRQLKGGWALGAGLKVLAAFFTGQIAEIFRAVERWNGYGSRGVSESYRSWSCPGRACGCAVRVKNPVFICHFLWPAQPLTQWWRELPRFPQWNVCFLSVLWFKDGLCIFSVICCCSGQTGQVSSRLKSTLRLLDGIP